MEEKEVYIIGAGVSGLIAAYELEQEGYTPVLLEKTNDFGGRVKTVEINGHQLDVGFQVLLDAYPLVKRYLDTDALQLKRLSPGALIYADNAAYLIGDPRRNLSYLIPVLFAKVGSFQDKKKILSLNKLLKKKSIEDIFSSPEKSTKQYLLDFGFSERIIQLFFQPFFTGIFLEPELRTSSRMFEFVYKMFGEGYATIPKNGIGAISKQLKGKLTKTRFEFNTTVRQVDTEKIVLDSDNVLKHQGVLIATEAHRLIANFRETPTSWKSCYCLYFEVDTTNIPRDTIALVSDQDTLINNLYAYRDTKSGAQILSATVVVPYKGSEEELRSAVEEEILRYAGCTKATFIHTFHIPQALPDTDQLRMDADASESEVLPNVYLAGDYLFNGSLNAAMQSGKLAAKALIAKNQGWQS